MGAEASEAAATVLGHSASGKEARNKRRQAGVGKARKLLLVHFRMNRVHCRVTYKVCVTATACVVSKGVGLHVLPADT